MFKRFFFSEAASRHKTLQQITCIRPIFFFRILRDFQGFFFSSSFFPTNGKKVKKDVENETRDRNLDSTSTVHVIQAKKTWEWYMINPDFYRYYVSHGIPKIFCLFVCLFVCPGDALGLNSPLQICNFIKCACFKLFWDHLSPLSPLLPHKNKKHSQLPSIYYRSISKA